MNRQELLEIIARQAQAIADAADRLDAQEAALEAARDERDRVQAELSRVNTHVGDIAEALGLNRGTHPGNVATIVRERHATSKAEP